MAGRTRRLGLRLDSELYDGLSALALREQVGVATAARRALRQRVDGTAAPAGSDMTPASQESMTQLQLVSLAALIGVEQMVRFLAKVYPEGEYRMLELRDQAAADAERHLEELKQHLDSEAAV